MPDTLSLLFHQPARQPPGRLDVRGLSQGPIYLGFFFFFLSIYLYSQHKQDSTHGHHRMVNTEIGLILFFAAKDGEALYSQQKQDQELTVAQTMNSLLPNSDLN